ncbi:MAG: chemotaxis protein CheW [Mariprofundaceae bacterium]|nr:chemotaxis protein CheW [Mariprofundaceae bacterium]
MAPTKSEDGLVDCWNRMGVWAHGKTSCPELAHVSHCRNCLVYIRAGRHKLDQVVPADYDMAWVNMWLNDQGDGAQKTLQRLLVFHLGQDDYFALPLAQVVEVLPMREANLIPHTNQHILRGLTHVRGELCLYISLCGALSRPPIVLTDDMQHKRLICIHIKGHSALFAVTQIHGIAAYQPASLQPLPDSLPVQQRQLCQGIISLTLAGQQAHTYVLDTERWQPLLDRLR